MYFSKDMKAWQRSYKYGTSFLNSTMYRSACFQIIMVIYSEVH